MSAIDDVFLTTPPRLSQSFGVGLKLFAAMQHCLVKLPAPLLYPWESMRLVAVVFGLGCPALGGV